MFRGIASASNRRILLVAGTEARSLLITGGATRTATPADTERYDPGRTDNEQQQEQQ